MPLNLMVRAGADFSAITTQAKKASTSMKGLGASFSAASGVMKKALGALGAAVSIAAIVSAAKSAAAAYNQQAEAEAKLAQVMKNTMGASNDEIRSIKDLTAAQQALGVVGDEVQLAGAQALAGYLSQTASLRKLIPVMNDMVAQQYGYSATAENAASVATMMGKVIAGQTSTLKRNGYTYTEAQEQILKYGTEEQRVATLAQIVEQRVGGMNAALAQTPTGRMQQLRNTLGDIRESFGQAVMTIATTFLPLLNRVASMLASIASVANRVAQSIANVFGKRITTGTAVAASGVSAAASAMDDLAESTSGAGKAAKEAAKSVLGFDVLNKLSDNSTTSSGSGTAAGASVPDIGGGLTGIEDIPAESSSRLENALTRLRGLLESINFEPLRSAATQLKEAFSQLVDVIRTGLSWAFDNILDPLAHWTIEKALPGRIGTLSAAFGLLSAALNVLKPPAKWIWENFLQPLGKWTGEVIIKALEDLKGVFEGLTEVLEGKTSFSEFLKNLSPSQSVLTSLLGAALAIKGITLALGGIKGAVAIASGALAFLTNPAGLVVIAIAAVIAIGIALYQHWDEIKAKFKEGWEELKGDWARVKESFAATGEAIKQAWTDLQSHWNDTVKPKIKAAWEELKSDWSAVKQSVSTVGDSIKQAWTGLHTHWNDSVMPALQAGWEDLKTDFENMKDALSTAGDAIKRGWTNLSTRWANVKQTISNKIGELQTDWENFKNAFSAAKDAVVQFANDLWAGVTAPFNAIQGLIDNLVSKCQTALSWLDQLSQRGEARIEAAGGIWGTLGGFAAGGWPDAGQVFVAREAGPELVGTIGGQTAVANNADIVAAVASGVAQAVAQVLNSGRGGGSTQPIILNINGREFARATYSDYRAVQNERGASLVSG